MLFTLRAASAACRFSLRNSSVLAAAAGTAWVAASGFHSPVLLDSPAPTDNNSAVEKAASGSVLQANNCLDDEETTGETPVLQEKEDDNAGQPVHRYDEAELREVCEQVR